MNIPLSSAGRLFAGCVSLSFLLFAYVGCSSDGSSHVESADRYFESGDYEKAEIEYKNVLQARKEDAHAIARLGIIYLEQGRIRQSVPYLRKAEELQPNNLDVRAKLGLLYLSSGKPKEAKEEAEYILVQEPTNALAPSILIEASVATPAEMAAAKQRLEALPGSASQGAPVLTAMGVMYLRQKNVAAAESALRQAIERDPEFGPAHSALGSLYWSRRDKANAEQLFKKAAETSPLRSGKLLQLAQFNIQAGDKDAARKLLEDAIKKAPDYLPAYLVLAELALAEKRYDDSAALTAKLLSKEGNYPEATLLSGRINLVRGNPSKAVEELERLTAAFPNHPQALYFLGLSHAAVGDKVKAVDRLNQAIKIAPIPEAILALAGVNLRTGDYTSVVVALKPFVQQHPANVQARTMLAEAYRAQGNFDDALTTYQGAQKDFPTNPQVPFQSGLLLLRQRNVAEATKAFEEALRRSPDYLPALEQLVNVDLAGRKYSEALNRLNAELGRNPNSSGLHLILGRAFAVQGENEKAEAAFRKAIELKPDASTAYFQLAQLYAKSNQQAKALTSLESLIARNPSDTKALLVTGLLQDQQKNYPAAREAYEKVLALDPRSSLALNNLAYLYSERFNELDKALELAQKARDLRPDDPHSADTFGWILYKKGQYARALGVLEDSSEALPDQAEVQYHLGMVRYAIGLEEPAREALQRSLELDGTASFAADVRRRLDVLSTNLESPNDATIAQLEKSIAAAPGDGIALVRMGAAYERMGSTAKAMSSYEAAARANPSNAAPVANLARLYAQSGDQQKALESAKAARKLSPEDPAVARSLGLIAHRAGDSTWGASLLQEAVRKSPADPELYAETAEVLYHVGKVNEARELMTQILQSPTIENGLKSTTLAGITDRARSFLVMTELAAKPAADSEQRIEDAIKADSQNLPALMALGVSQESKGNFDVARETYLKILGRAPEFIPAKLRLAVIASTETKLDPKALDWARQARAAYPDDAVVARALGILSHRNGGEPSRTIALLQDALRADPEDAESSYYMGLAQLLNKQEIAGLESLRKAVTLGLKPELAADATQRLKPKK